MAPGPPAEAPQSDTRAVPPALLLILGLATAAVGGGGTEPSTAAAKRGTATKVVDSQYGRILADRRGQAVYVFDKETTRTSECYGDCAKAWPPVLTKGRPRAGKGARACASSAACGW
jgi:predicted lipoprotein with Yx(FWY)xxD motif